MTDAKHKFVVRDYFLHDKHPTLLSPKGAAISPDVVQALAGSLAPGQYAQAGAPQPAQAQAIGRVVSVSGNVIAVRNGVSITLHTGDALLKGDVLQTGADSKLAVTFNDGATFDLGANARIVLTEFVYAPNSDSNSSVVNLVRGQLSFIAGEIAHTGSMKVQTPVATMGIRGTVGIVSFGDSLTLTVANEHDGVIHSIDIRDTNGNIVGHATSNGGTWHVTAVGAQQVNAFETTRELNVTQDLQVVQTLLNLQSIGQQIIQQLQHDAQSNGSTGSSSALNVTVEHEDNSTKVTATTTDTSGSGSDDGTGTGGTGTTEQYIQYIPPSSTNPAPIFDSGPVVVHVATQNTGVRLAPQDPGVALPSPGAPYALAPDVSADGHRMVFVTSATLPSSGGGDLSNGNVWLYDQTTGTLTNISDATYSQWRQHIQHI